MAAPLAQPRAPLTRRLVGFVRLLRDNGFALGLREAEDAVRAAEARALRDRSRCAGACGRCSVPASATGAGSTSCSMRTGCVAACAARS